MHKYKPIAGIVISFLLFCSILFVINPNYSSAEGDTLWVDDNVFYPELADGSIYNPYKTIQAAIEASKDGDKILVLPGVYEGDLTIDKSVTISTDYKDNTIIRSTQRNTNMIEIRADDVSLEMFRIQDRTSTSHRKNVIYVAPGVENAVIIDNRFDHSNYGYSIKVEDANNVVIKNNTIENLTLGVRLINSEGSSIYENVISNCTDSAALYLSSSHNNKIERNVFKLSKYGVQLSNSNGNLIHKNRISENPNRGVFISGGKNNSILDNRINASTNTGVYLDLGDDVHIKDNYITDNVIGIILSADNCEIENNTIANSTVFGLQATSLSDNNLIFDNTFITSYDSKELHAKEEGDNTWYDETSATGNYWDDFYGPNPNIENTTVPAGHSSFTYTKGGVYDLYPQGRYKSTPVISKEDPLHLASGVQLRPRLGVKIHDYDPDPYKERMDVDFYYILENVSYYIDTANSIESGEWATIPFYSTIQGKNSVYSYIGTGYDYICEWYAVVKNQYSQTVSSNYIFTTKHIPIDNDVPVANAGGKYKGQVGENIQFDGSGCTDSDGTIIYYRWSFGDGNSVTNVESPSHIYLSPATYDASLVIIDDDGSSATENFKVTIKGQEPDEPIADAGGPYNAIVGQVVYFSSSGTTDPDLSTSGYDEVLSYWWDFGDGTNSTEANPSHNYSQVGNYTVTLTVTDKTGLNDVATSYALIKTNEEESPGFEMFVVIVAMGIIFYIKRRKTK